MPRYLPFILLLLCNCALTGPADESTETDPTDPTPPAFEISFGTDEYFEVVTWNIETFPKHERTVEYAARTLRGVRPDVLAIQEVWSAQALNELRDQLPGYEICVPPDMADTGLAYLYSRETIELLESPYRIFTEDNYDFAWRPPFVLRVRFGQSDLTVINMHLKCCGDGYLGDDYWDEELRRQNSANALKAYIEEHLSDEAVIVVGDWNDSIDEPEDTNVFWSLTQDSASYRFADMDIATGSTSEWSFPYYPSHIDHLLITNELFESFDGPDSKAQTLKVDAILPGGMDEYWEYLSDHRPVGLRLAF